VRPHRLALVVAALAAAFLASLGATARVARAQDAPPDSIVDLFRQLADSTDASYGDSSVAYDKTGLDSLAGLGFDELPPPRERRSRQGASFSPVLSYHRATGVMTGAGMTFRNLKAGELHLEGSYGFESKAGRYEARWRKPLYVRHNNRPYRSLYEPHIEEHRTELDLVLGYARSDENFMPEHARPKAGSLRALFFGRDEQSIYEQRAFKGGLNFWTGDWRLSAGWEDGKDRSMQRETRFSFFGDRDSVPENLPADFDEFSGPTGGIAYEREDWELAARIDARGGGEDRWRVRGALGKAVRLGNSLKLYGQYEYGAAATDAPLQRMFSVGGPRLLRTVRTGVTMADHLMGAKLELVSSIDVLRSIGIGGPDWLVLNPWVFGEAAAIWDDAAGRNVVFAQPPSQAWRGGAGGGFLFRPGVPDPDVWVRFGYVARVGHKPGQSHFTISIDRAFDLIGVL
jgi:hypothetical protein